MSQFVLIPLVACLLSSLSALAILLRDPDHPTNRLATALVGVGSWWGFCQILWTLSPTPGWAVFWHKIASMGWAFIGPLALHLMVALVRGPHLWARRVLRFAYPISAVFMLLHMTTSLIFHGAARTDWGWGFQAGPAHVPFFVYTLSLTLPAMVIGIREVRTSPEPAKRRQLRLVALGIVVPMFAGGITGGLLPLFGLQVPRLGPASFSLLGLTIAWSYQRYGYSALAPGTFSKEILETLQDGLGFVSMSGEVLSCNEQLARLVGLTHAEMEGFPIVKALGIDDFDAMTEIRERECVLVPVAGDRLTVSVTAKPLADKLGLPIGTVLVVRDLREVVSLRNHLVTSGRLAAVGELAAGIAHEINNPMAFVRANLTQLGRHWHALQDKLTRDERDSTETRLLLSEGDELIAECVEGVERTTEIVRGVKGIARGSGDQRQPTDPNAVLDAALRVASPQLRAGIEVERTYETVPPIVASGPELQQVFLNLIVNAIQAIEGKGHIRLATRVEEEFVAIEIGDDGCGIEEEDIDRIFDPFFTTKPVGEGTGLGLAISFQILRSHDAQMSVASAPDVGTTFTLRFPLDA